MAGTTRSHRSATMTIAVALSASNMVPGVSPLRRFSAARSAGEEDHALGVARDVLEGRHHAGPAPARRGRRDGGPHPELELPAELRHEDLLLLAHLDVALGQEH